ALFGLSSSLYLSSSIPWLAMAAMNSFAIYASFTPLHDATHRTASGNRRLNDLLGTLSCLLLLPGITTRIYRYLHLEHHRYAGDASKDPDEPFVSSRGWRVPLTLAGLDVLWTRWYLARWNTRPAGERLEFTLSIAFYVLFHVAWLASPYALEFILIWVIPQRLGLFYVSWFFARIQHLKDVYWEQTPFQTTVRVVTNAFARVMLLGQANHHVHHLAPSVPYYRYHRAWDLGKSLLQDQNIPTRTLFAETQNLKLPATESEQWLSARVHSVDLVATDIRSYTLEPADDAAWPSFTAGAHIDVCATPDMVRQYSLCNSPADANHYTISVKRDPKGRGGSEYMHTQVSAGDTLRISTPRNHFPLDSSYSDYLLIAAGIGITPLLAMAHQLDLNGQGFSLHVCDRNAAASMISERSADLPFADQIVHHFDNNQRGTGFDPVEALGTHTLGRALYLCGPTGFMAWVMDVAQNKGWPENAIFSETFVPPSAPAQENSAFEVRLARSGTVLQIGAGESLLDVLNRNHCAVICSCTQGICGSCMTPVLEGVPEHRDAIMTDAERDKNDQMTVCVSRSQSARLVLDL
ncbi:MAG: fatty acid desaturase, partial [Pseudomonadales bacterium]